MNSHDLYILSAGFRDSLCATAARMTNLVEIPLVLVEIIILPDFGQRIILRFGPGKDDKLTFEEGDQLESCLRKLAGRGYWVTMIGDSYQESVTDMGQRLISIDQRVSSDLLRYPPTRHSARIREDAIKIREALNLTGDDLIWEIEIPISEKSWEPIIRIIDTRPAGEKGPRQEPTVEQHKMGGIDFTVEILPNDPSFVGCLKAYIMANQQHKALTSYIAQF